MIRNFITAIAATLALCAPLLAQATDVNRASQAELESVKGIGPGLSGKILKARGPAPSRAGPTSWTASAAWVPAAPSSSRPTA